MRLANKNVSLFCMFVSCGPSLTILNSAFKYIGLEKPYEMSTRGANQRCSDPQLIEATDFFKLFSDGRSVARWEMEGLGPKSQVE